MSSEEIMVNIIGVLVGFLQIIIVGILSVIWAKISKLENKNEEHLKRQLECQKNLPLDFLTRQEFGKFQEQRKEQWDEFLDKFEKLLDRFYRHTHDPNGSVSRN